MSTEKYRQQREQAVRAAAAVFADHGYHGSSTRDIAQRLGIKQGSLYYYFKSKEEALEEVCLLAMRDYVARMETIAAGSQPFEAKLQAIIVAHLAAYREKNEALKVYNTERLYLPPERRSRLKKLGSHYRGLLQRVLEQAQSDGRVRATLDCHFAAQCVIGTCNAWGELIVRDPDLDVILLAQQCAELLLNGAATPIRSD